MSAIADTAALPSGREEGWKYTPVAEIAAALRASVPAPLAASVSRSLVDDLAGDLGCPRLVFVNGVRAQDLSDDMPAGLTIESAADAATIVVAGDVDVVTPLHLVHVSAPADVRGLSHPRTVIGAAPGSRLSLIETYCGAPGPSFTDASTTIRVAPAAHVDHVRIQAERADAIHLGHTFVEQADASSTHLTAVTIGADIARHQTDVRLTGADARVDLDGLYLPTRHQRHDNVVVVDHAASRGTSTQCFKGVIDGHARGSFSGHVIVRADTVGNDAQQTNRNLVLSGTAEADSRPWLEIFADDVRCTHGATVGRLDDDALFYLRSRGIPLTQSRGLLVSGFIAEIVDTIAPASVRAWVAAEIARLLLGAPQ
jgi:Fe-S cluster assembly protein SufD